MTKKALENIRVLDLARVLAGPWCTQNMADLGAEVIKVERPKVGDDIRGWGPPWLKDKDGEDSTDSTYFSATNRGKKSITVDLSTPEGQQLIKEIAAECDVFIENYKVGDMKRYGLDYESISKINPAIVYCSITGYGQDGPDSYKPGYDFVFQGMSGLMSITGERDDLPGGGPQKMGIAVADVITGMYALSSILAALYYREQTGQGQYIDMSLLDCMVSISGNQAVGYMVSGEIPKRYGNAHMSVVPYQVFKTTDREIIIAVGNNGQFRALCDALDRPDLWEDERYQSPSGRIVNRETLIPELERTFLTAETKLWIERLDARKVPCGAVNNFKQVFEEPQVIHRGLQLELKRDDGTVVPAVASPYVMSKSPADHSSPPPLLGEHTEAILSRVLNKSSEEIKELRRKNVV